jgi:hypothetical protein
VADTAGLSAGRKEPFPCNTGEVPPADYIRPETSPNGDKFNVRNPLAGAATATGPTTNLK